MTLYGKQPGLLVAVFLPAVLSTLVILFRTTRKMKRMPKHISKYGAITAEALIILGVVSGWVSGGFVLASMHYGFGRHQATILSEPHGLQKLTRAAFWQVTGYSFNVGFYCLSVAGQVMHYRIWLLNKVDGYRMLNTVMVASGLIQATLGAICIISSQATAGRKMSFWDSTQVAVPPISCLEDTNEPQYASSALTFVSYMIQAWIPLHLAYRLQRGKLERNKWTALCILAFWNVIAGVLALVKLGHLHLYVDEVDATYRRVILVEIGLAENGASGICPSAAEMWSLAQRLRRGHGTGTSQDRSVYVGSGHKGTGASPPSNSSDVELTGEINDEPIGMGIVRTTAWETAVVAFAKEDGWSRLSDQDGIAFDAELYKPAGSRLRL
ncbi:G-protein-coupled receptor [Teratosphaeria destructans]|uniref:G-protein-coupled receptor n=1 Tax=Teratosphaeria destructans TaxID=418781 RepID=A0A9W7W0I8_9PEZI|nr:G-protein-coupled receptor [Teratosphaeria destructans]